MLQGTEYEKEGEEHRVKQRRARRVILLIGGLQQESGGLPTATGLFPVMCSIAAQLHNCTSA